MALASGALVALASGASSATEDPVATLTRGAVCDGPCMLTVRIRGSGAGLVRSDPSELACRTDCSTTGFSPSTIVTLAAVPDAGSWVSGFDGCSPLSGGRCTFEMPATDALLTVVFDRIGGPVTPPTPPVEAPPPPKVPAPPPPPGCTIGGTPGDDVLYGLAENDVICALGGDDHIHGGGGNDVVRAGPGNDVVEGQDGDDRIDGGLGDDVLHGDRGRDRLVGRGGADRLAGGPGGDELRARDGTRDVVRGGAGIDTARVDRRDRLRGVERRLP